MIIMRINNKISYSDFPACSVQYYVRFLLVVSKRFLAILTWDYRRQTGMSETFRRGFATLCGFSRAAAFTGIHFARAVQRDRTDKPFRRERNSGRVRIKFPAGRDAELSCDFVRELIMFRNRRPGDRERTIYTWWMRTAWPKRERECVSSTPRKAKRVRTRRANAEGRKSENEGEGKITDGQWQSFLRFSLFVRLHSRLSKLAINPLSPFPTPCPLIHPLAVYARVRTLETARFVESSEWDCKLT